MVAVVVPALLVWAYGAHFGWDLPAPASILLVIAGLCLLGVGLWLWLETIRLFVSVGKGTLAPWDPPRRFVVSGPYRRVRNPMISALGFVLLGEAALLGSRAVLILFAGFAITNLLDRRRRRDRPLRLLRRAGRRLALPGGRRDHCGGRPHGHFHSAQPALRQRAGEARRRPAPASHPEPDPRAARLLAAVDRFAARRFGQNAPARRSVRLRPRRRSRSTHERRLVRPGSSGRPTSASPAGRAFPRR